MRTSSTTGGATDAPRLIDLFPATAVVDGGELHLGGMRATTLAEAFGTPLVVYCRETILARAHAYARVDPDALVVYGTKAFPNIALMRLLAAEGLGADVSTRGELEFALRAGVPGDRLVFHGNNKSDEELRAAAAAGAFVVLDALDEAARARAAGVQTVLVRVTPGIEAETHRAIRTAHAESKFGLVAGDAVAAVREALAAGLDVAGLHVHIGSQLTRAAESLLAVERLVDVAMRCREELGWSPRVFDLGGGLAVRHSLADTVPDAEEFARELLLRLRRHWHEPAQAIFEPGRSLVGQAGFTLYRIGVVKRTAGVAYAAIDGGMSDNPRPQLYGSRYEALLANRADEPSSGAYRIAGKHCESGDVLIDSVELPEPRRGDLLAVPATGAYTLAMASNYNGVPRPAAVLVADGEAELIRRRESLDDLLSAEPSNQG
ncbi:MAG: diaminopimelate decarboxylase [Actinobacteria bacterium]|nr:MAG: diaminopimelate decarboxylase [Actinomycetota bacterium]